LYYLLRKVLRMSAMKVWSLVSQKGGSGKTTLTLQLAIAAMTKNLIVSIIDLDPQRSAEQWSNLRKSLLDPDAPHEPVIVPGIPSELGDMLEDAAGDNAQSDLTLIDTPPAVDKTMISAASAADLVIVPTRTGILDRFAVDDTLNYLNMMGALGKTVVIINAAPNDKDEIQELKDFLVNKYNVRILKTAIEMNTDYSKSLGDGEGVAKTMSRKKSGKAMRALYEELCSI
jgi:chromosome partitioning protein